MNNSFIIKQIRKNQTSQLLLPVLLIIFFTFVLISVPKDNVFNPRPINPKSQFENFYNRDLPHVTISAPMLSYSGLDYVVDGHIKGHYYYALSENFCQFYLLLAETASPERTIEAKNIRGQLIRLDDIEYRAIVKSMAGQLSWKTSSLQNMTAPYAISTISHAFYLTLFFFLILYGGIFLFAADILYRIFYLWKPVYAPTFRCISSRKARYNLCEKAGAELDQMPTLKSGQIYLTPSFLIILQTSPDIIIPLSAILNFSYYSHKKKFSKKAHGLRYTLSVTTKDGHTYRVTRNDIKDLELLVSSLSRLLASSQYTNEITFNNKLPI